MRFPGGQVGAREAMAAVSGILAPLIGGWVLVSGGPIILFAAAGVLQALSALPLIGAPNIQVARKAPGAYRAAAGLMAAGLPLSTSILLGLAGSLASFALIWRGYTARSWA